MTNNNLENSLSLIKKAKITEVCPRDGWQNIGFIDTDIKVQIIEKIISIGIDEIEITSFVHPKWVPQFKDSNDVVKKTKIICENLNRNVKLIALVPNGKGVQRSIEAGLDTINYVISVSEEHNKRNVKRTVVESFDNLKTILQEHKNINIRLALACTFGSPFGDPINLDDVKELSTKALEMGVEKIGYGDSAGLCTPSKMRTTLREIKKYVDLDKISLHLHDTRGMGIANSYVAVEEGIYQFDTSLGGLGGCPFIPGAAGNISTEDFANMLTEMKIETNFDLTKLLEASIFLRNKVESNYNSRIQQMNL